MGIRERQRRRAPPDQGTRPALRQHHRHGGRHALSSGSTGSLRRTSRLYVKCEFFNPAASVKDRLALNIIEAAERDGTLKPGQTVVEATSGNTGIGLAMVCAAKGYPLVVTMADSLLGGAAAAHALPRRQGGADAARAEGLRDVHEGQGARRRERLVPRAPVRDAGQRRHPREHHRGRDPRRLQGRAARLFRLRLRHRRHGGGRRAGAEEELPEGEDHPLRAGQRPARRLGGPAAAHRGRRAGERAHRLRAAPDPGLDAGLHPAGAAGGDRRALLRRGHPDPRRRGDEVGARARRQGGDHDRRLRRLDLRHRRCRWPRRRRRGR